MLWSDNIQLNTAVQAWNVIHFPQKKCTRFIYICSTENPAAVMRNVLQGFGLVIYYSHDAHSQAAISGVWHSRQTLTYVTTEWGNNDEANMPTERR